MEAFHSEGLYKLKARVCIIFFCDPGIFFFADDIEQKRMSLIAAIYIIYLRFKYLYTRTQYAKCILYILTYE